MSGKREFDVILWGATGFTGGLAAEYLAEKYGDSVSWAIAGRSKAKLEAVKEGLVAINRACEAVGIVTASIDDEDSLDALTQLTAVVASTVGPFLNYGPPLVAACVRNGTHYCDITGEAPFIRDNIDAHHAAAEKAGVLIVSSCGFDSLPADLGTLYAINHVREKHGKAVKRVKAVVSSNGTLSGGTFHTMLNLMSTGRAREGGRPFYLNPDPRFRRATPFELDFASYRYEPAIDRWEVPFIMAAINTRNVRRSAALNEEVYGKDFEYNETQAQRSRWAAITTMLVLTVFVLCLFIAPLRWLLTRVMPAPGEGPGAARRARSRFRYTLIATAEDDSTTLCTVSGGDPGYTETSRWLVESALCMAHDYDKLPCKGGVVPPAAAMGEVLIERVQACGTEFAAS